MEFLAGVINSVELTGTDILFNFLIVLIGTVVHFMKKTNQDGVSMKDYWLTKKKQSVISIVGSIVGFIILVKMGDNASLNYFAIGYMSDSFLNRMESNMESRVSKVL